MTLDLSQLPPGIQNPQANKSNALQFLLDNQSDEDTEYVEMMHISILEGLFIYLGNGRLQITQLGYLFLSSKEKEN